VRDLRANQSEALGRDDAGRDARASAAPASTGLPATALPATAGPDSARPDSARPDSALKTAALTAAAMAAFAANSLLCRAALGAQLIDPASFTTARTLAGAVTLGLLAFPALRRDGLRASPRGVAALTAYMLCFSFAYVTLDAGTGALLLFGAVQLTMLVAALRGGERFGAPAWIGFGAAIAGLIWLVSPGVAAPEPPGAALMLCAGIAWGVYSLRGRTAQAPLLATAGNFVFAVIPCAAVSAMFIGSFQVSAAGLLLAAASGSLASGIGYAIWYAALRGLSAGRAAAVQLSVPLIAALGGVALLDERFTPRLGVAAVLTIGGIALVLRRRRAGD